MGHAKTNTSPELDDRELEVLKLFISGMNRIGAYREVFKIDISDKTIYNWYKTTKVQTYLREYEDSLTDYNVVTDKILLQIMQSEQSKDKDKIAAIKIWSDIRNRIKNTIKIESEQTINLGDVNDEDIEKLITAFQNGSK